MITLLNMPHMHVSLYKTALDRCLGMVLATCFFVHKPYTITFKLCMHWTLLPTAALIVMPWAPFAYFIVIHIYTETHPFLSDLIAHCYHFA